MFISKLTLIAFWNTISMKNKFFIEELSFKQQSFVIVLQILRIFFTPIALIIFFLYLFHTIIEEILHYFPRFRGWFDTRISIRKLNIVTTGGTGGHLFPAINFAIECNQENRIVLISDANSITVILKRNLVKKGFITNSINSPTGAILSLTLPILPLRNNIKSLFCLCVSMFKSMMHFMLCGFLFRKTIGFGGYASFPTLFWSVIFRKPIFLHEQNAVFGKVNLIFAIFARKIFTFLPVNSSLHGVYNVGMPLSEAIASNPRIIKREQTDTIQLLIISGTSGGAESIKSILPAVINFSRRHKNLHVMHQAGENIAQEIRDRYSKHQISCEVKPFFSDIYSILPKIDICISRSGASSIVDLLAFGVPTIFIPLRTSADDHQMKNANWVVQNHIGFLHKPWESNSYNLTSLMHLCYSKTFMEQTAYLGQLAIKRGASERISEEIFGNINDYYA